MQNSLIPKSIPTALPVFSNGLISTSVQQSDTKYFPLGSCDIVALRILPCGTNLFFVFTIPSLGNLIYLSQYWILPFTHFDLYENLCVFFDLNLGYPACSLKNFLYAESKSLSED